MSARELVQELENLGVRLWEVDGRLHFRAPKGVFTEDRRAALAAQKESVLAHLRDSGTYIVPHPEARYEPFPVTDVQSAYLVGRRKGVPYGEVGCHAYGELTLERADAERLGAALRYLIRRHDMLRVAFLSDGSQQVLESVPEYRIEVADLTGLSAEATERGLSAFRKAMAHRVYDPGKWPLFDVRLSRTDGIDRLHISIDFLIADYSSIFVLLAELQQKYEAPSLELPELPLTFRDYLLASKARRSGYAYERDREYWMARLNDFPSAPELPTLAAANEDADPVRFRRWEFLLGDQAWKSFAHLAKLNGLTPSAGVLTSFASVIGYWSRYQRFAIDLTLLDRPAMNTDLARIIGDFTSVSLLEVDHRMAESFFERARKLQRQLGQDMEHSLFSGVEFIRELARVRGIREALMPIVFTSAVGLSLNGGEMPMGEFAGGISQTPQVWIDCQVMERAGCLSVVWDVREGVFSSELIDTMFAGFEEMVRELAQQPDSWTGKFPLALPPMQLARRKLANSTESPIPQGSLVSDALIWARWQPNTPCLLTQDSSFTYGETMRYAAAVKAAIESSGIKPGQLVAVIAPKGPMQIVAVLGILLAGGAYLPIDASEPAARREEILADANITTAVTDSTVAIDERIRQIVLSSLTMAETLPRSTPVTPDQLAYTIYTSGSTGKPKGVMVSHLSALNTIRDIDARFRLGAQDRVLCVSSLAFDLSVYDIFGLLSVGGCLVFPSETRRTDPSHWAELIAQHSVTVWNSVPALVSMLLDYRAITHDTSPTSLRLALLSGDWISPGLVKRARAAFPGLEMAALGGATEGSIWSIFYPLRDLPENAAFVPYGRPLANQTVHVLNDALQPAPDGVAGEICLGGLGVAMGYLNNPAQTQERFITGRSGEGRLYRTGDRGQYLPDGNIEILGREDAQVKIRGHRVELGEIEAALEKHPSIDHAVVAVRGRGGEQRRLVAFAQSVTVPLLLPGDVAGRAAEASAAFLSGEHVGGFSEYTRMLDRAALASIMDCFRAAGLFTGDDGHKLEDIFRSLQARSGFHRLVRRWLNAAVNDGFLIREGDAYRASAEASALHAPMEWKRIEQLTPRFDSPLLLEYFRNSGESLLLLIRSKRAAFDMLYPHGRPDISISLHEHSLLNRWGNIVAAAMARHIAESANLDGPLRVLEIGGGVGGTTASILSVLPGPYEYWFTDVSQYFLNHARERFAGNRSLHFSIYDINRSYQEQGLPPNTFDIIVAGDVLHVARHVPRLLSELRELLRPGGWLLALEMTRDHYQIMTTLELLNTDENGSVYEDSRQHRDQTFYTRDEWLQLFEASHADTVAMIPAHDGAFFEAGLCIAAARYKADRAAVDPEALAKFLRDRLPDYMAPAEIRLLDQLPLTPNGKVNRKLLTEWASIEPAAATEIIPFDSDLEADLGAIWSSVLGLAAVDRSLDFLAAGGDSLLAAQLTGRIIEEIPIARDIFFDDLLRRVLEGPTLPELARILQRTANPGEGSDDTIDSNILVPLGGAHYPTACVVIREAGTTLAGCSVQAEALTSRMCLYEAEIERDEEVLPVLAERCVRILRRGDARGVHLVGYGQGNLLAVELARQMLDAGDPLLSVTVTSLAGYREHLAPSVDVLAYAGDLNLLCRESQTDNGVEDFWRSVCLGNFRVRRLKTTSPESVTEGLLEILGE